jgi:hypothetical protein
MLTLGSYIGGDNFSLSEHSDRSWAHVSPFRTPAHLYVYLGLTVGTELHK